MFLNDPTVPTPEERLVVEASVTVKDATSLTIGELKWQKGSEKCWYPAVTHRTRLNFKSAPARGQRKTNQK